MRTPLATITLTLALSLPGLSSADVYKCPAPGGKMIYQNAPCTANEEPAILSPGPGSRYVGPPVVPQAPAHVPEASPRSPQHESVREASGGPVDTRAFGMLAIGSSERDVLAKLGQPDRTFEAAKTFVPVRRAGGGVELREKIRSAWVYDSDGYTLRTVLFFEDGRLVSKEKQGR